MKRYALAAGAAAQIILLSACGSSGSPETAPPPSGAIVISNSVYSGSMTVKPGAEVTVTNKDSMKHGLASTKTLFSIGTVEGNGGTETFTAPAVAGSYPVHCLFHANMVGTLRVQG